MEKRWDRSAGKEEQRGKMRLDLSTSISFRSPPSFFLSLSTSVFLLSTFSKLTKAVARLLSHRRAYCKSCRQTPLPPPFPSSFTPTFVTFLLAFTLLIWSLYLSIKSSHFFKFPLFLTVYIFFVFIYLIVDYQRICVFLLVENGQIFLLIMYLRFPVFEQKNKGFKGKNYFFKFII